VNGQSALFLEVALQVVTLQDVLTDGSTKILIFFQPENTEETNTGAGDKPSYHMKSEP
jgi:hypothetical protein